jgi:hypothetical protein
LGESPDASDEERKRKFQKIIVCTTQEVVDAAKRGGYFIIDPPSEHPGSASTQSKHLLHLTKDTDLTLHISLLFDMKEEPTCPEN